MTARQQEPKHTTHSPLPTLTSDCQRQLTTLIANLIESYLSKQGVFDTEPADEPYSSGDCIHPSNTSIKEDCHAHHRAAFAENH